MKAPAHTRKSTDSWWAAEERNNTTRSNAVMKIHFRLLVTIGNLVSLSSFPLSGQVRGTG